MLVGGTERENFTPPTPPAESDHDERDDDCRHRHRARLVEFASDVTRLADGRHDTELRVLVDDLHADLIRARFDAEEEKD
jgi:hypothetical protein